MFGSNELYNALNDSAITDLLDAFSLSPALFSDSLIPQAFTGDASINFYMSGSYDATLSYDDYTYTVNCRDKSYSGSRTIAYAVISTINRVNYSDYYIVCKLMGTIPPMDDTDNYNSPVEVKIKKR